MSALNYMSLLNQYNNIDNELNYLFENKYATPDKFVKFIYYGYMNYNMSLRSEDSRYVLIDKTNQTWEFAKSISDVKLFLDLQDECIIDDIYALIHKEDQIRIMLELQGINPEINYSRKLSIALV
jgi:hypothetical protein